MIFSASSPIAAEKFNSSFYFLKRHLLWLMIGYIFLFLGYLIDLKKLQNISIFLMFFAIILLLLVLFPSIGYSVGGAKRWIRVSNFGFQPSEIAKIIFIIYLASWLDRKHQFMNRNFTHLLPNFILLGTALVLIYKEPDLGTVILMGIIFLLMFIVSGIDKKYIISFFVLGTAGFFYSIISTSYRLKRVLAFLNPFDHFSDSGYQVVQSYLAIANSGIFGKGIGGSKLKLLYLPEAHTDFIFSIIIEELGIFGTTSVILFYILFVFISTKIILKENNYFSKLLGFGLIMSISTQAFINIAVITGTFPTKGITLPFLSFGGTSLVMTMFSAGIILNIYKRTANI
jgi:cell division protein FtsW